MLGIMLMPRRILDPTKYKPLTDAEVDLIAEPAHEAYAGYCRAHYGLDVPRWADLDSAGKQWARLGVRKQFEATVFYRAADLHQHWMDAKLAEGWTYGPIKDVATKTHPSLVPYDELPFVERAKDGLFSVVAGIGWGLIEEARKTKPQA
jgi:hypothetical protein